MGMSTHVTGFKPPNERWKKMKEVYDTCVKNGVDVPEEVNIFFEYEEPDVRGVEVNIVNSKATSDWSDDRSRSGYEVDITKLPKDVTVIRFYNSW